MAGSEDINDENRKMCDTIEYGELRNENRKEASKTIGGSELPIRTPGRAEEEIATFDRCRNVQRQVC